MIQERRSAGPAVALALIAWLPLALAAACSGGGGGREASEPAAGGPAAAGEPGGPGGAEPASGPLTEEDCMRYVDHILELAMAEKRATLPPDQVPTDEQVAEIRANMRAAAAGERCVGQPRAPFDCAMRATTTADVRSCFEEAGG